jgi:hypothetical protein
LTGLAGVLEEFFREEMEIIVKEEEEFQNWKSSLSPNFAIKSPQPPQVVQGLIN